MNLYQNNHSGCKNHIAPKVDKKLTKSNTCNICDDIGVIPVVEYENGVPKKYHGKACKCAIGKMYEKHYGSYFDHFGAYQFPWDKTRHEKYCQCVEDNYIKLLKETPKLIVEAQ